MHTVSHAELMTHTLVTHQLMHESIDITERIIITTIEEPFYGA